MKKNISIYIHIPFCDSKCYYCGFCSSVQNFETKSRYSQALKNEIALFKIEEACNISDDIEVKTIYFGGGTPSSVDPVFIKDILTEIGKKFIIASDAEITIECNPNSSTEQKFILYKEMGINRISFGVQSFNKRSLKFVGRVKDDKKLNEYKRNVICCLKTAKKVGLQNISVDFILGLPYQSDFQLKTFLKSVSKYATHFSCYMLQVEEGTKLAQILPNGVDDDKLADQYELAVKTLKKLGFERYEISNFAKKGYESKHNKVYWKRTEYLGFGLASHSFYKELRIANTEDLEKYMGFWKDRKRAVSVLDLEKKGIVTIEKLNKKEMMEETLMLSLRTEKGLNLIDFKEKYFDLEKHHAKKIAMMIKNGLINIEGNILRLTTKGFLVANDIIGNFADDILGLFIEL